MLGVVLTLHSYLRSRASESLLVNGKVGTDLFGDLILKELNGTTGS